MKEREIIYDASPEKFYEIYEIISSSVDYISPKDEFHICRYCTLTNPTFKSKAHFLPEFMGNKTLFSFNECDGCNRKFGLYETNLSAFSGIKNSFVPIKGKKKYPKFKSNDGKFTNQVYDGNKVITKVEGDTDFMKLENGTLHIKAETQTFTPLYVYKALVKFALSMLKKEEVFKFKKTFDWIGEAEKKYDDNLTPLLLIHNESRPPLIQPIAILSKRKNSEINSPEFTFILAFGFHRLQIFLPFNSSDEKLLNNEKTILPLNFHFVTQKEKNKGNWGFGHFDMNSLKKVRLTDDFKLNFTLSEDKE
ncbi:hypothetical protein [Flavobacterium succinicans]|jgi:hypothetical protein|uniref:HNH endonuclease 5 domain-containing protein n=1 Tax=Flavobacterium succinicans TaxID=29536 RepID=A0A199XR49_9FLAO|nr:hypothetical protein [Flavobacterium succinicans]OAZ04120.1 hypothetical protein FLB_14890 [Flavobacterium succinicans]